MARTIRTNRVKEVRLFDYRLEHDPRFLNRVEQARSSLRTGRGVKLEDLDDE